MRVRLKAERLQHAAKLRTCGICKRWKHGRRHTVATLDEEVLRITIVLCESPRLEVPLRPRELDVCHCGLLWKNLGDGPVVLFHVLVKLNMRDPHIKGKVLVNKVLVLGEDTAACGALHPDTILPAVDPVVVIITPFVKFVAEVAVYATLNVFLRFVEGDSASGESLWDLAFPCKTSVGPDLSFGNMIDCWITS